jgi:hypothetical protein
MRAFVPAGALCLIFATTPASAMCGSQQTQASGQSVSSGMMCGPSQAADDPMADKPTAQQPRSSMCPCCQRMGMMRGGGMGGMNHNMPGMDQPKQ